MARFLNTRTPFYRKRRPTPVSIFSFATANITVVANAGTFNYTGINTNFGITQSEQDDQTFVITGNSANFNTNTVAALATGAFTLTGVSTNFGRGFGVTANSFSLTGIANLYGIKFGLNPTAFTLTGNDVTLLTVSRRRAYGYIIR